MSTALNAIEVFIKGVLPDAQIARTGRDELSVRNGEKSIRLPFNSGQLEDFEVVLQGGQPAPYAEGLRADLHNRIFVALGTQGMIPHFRITEVLVNEKKRDWLATCRIACTDFSEQEARGLFDSLVQLQKFLRQLLKGHVRLPAMQAELAIVDNLAAWYLENGSLNAQDVQLESLSYLKGAVLCWVLRLQAAKDTSPIQRVKAAYDKEIYELVQRFWVAYPYHRIQLPQVVHDFVTQMRSSLNSTPLLPHEPHVDIESALKTMDVRLWERWQGAYQALNSSNLDRVSQAANSMVEVLDKVIDRVRGEKEFKAFVAERFPAQADVAVAYLKLISQVKTSLQSVKHHTKEQSAQDAQDLMHHAELLIRMLLRTTR